MKKNNIYTIPKIIKDIKDCYFYHAFNLPDKSTVKGEWDLRNGAKQYLGNVKFKGKSVLELGTASGFLCFYMESQGAEVVAHDLSPKDSWDIVPYPNRDNSKALRDRKKHIEKLNNSFWYCHRMFKSKSKLVQSSVYDIPEELGEFDITTFGAILLHLRDPLRALEKILKMTKETIIITDLVPPYNQPKTEKPMMFFNPDVKKNDQSETWWLIPPDTIIQFISLFGFEDIKVNYHTQKFMMEQTMNLYTIVGHRKVKGRKKYIIF